MAIRRSAHERAQRRPAHLALLASATIAVLILAGCFGEGRAEDSMTISNQTDAPITVTYEYTTGGGRGLLELDPGEVSLVAPTLFGSKRCLPGEFVARTGDAVVDRLPQPCKQQVWEVTGDEDPSAG
jgi:hypothetical protein